MVHIVQVDYVFYIIARARYIFYIFEGSVSANDGARFRYGEYVYKFVYNVRNDKL